MSTLFQKIIDLQRSQQLWALFGDHYHQDDGEDDDDDNDDDGDDDNEIWGLCPQQRWLAVVEEVLLHTPQRMLLLVIIMMTTTTMTTTTMMMIILTMVNWGTFAQKERGHSFSWSDFRNRKLVRFQKWFGQKDAAFLLFCCRPKYMAILEIFNIWSSAHILDLRWSRLTWKKNKCC